MVVSQDNVISIIDADFFNQIRYFSIKYPIVLMRLVDPVPGRIHISNCRSMWNVTCGLMVIISSVNIASELEVETLESADIV